VYLISSFYFYFTLFYRFYNLFRLGKMSFVVIDDSEVADEIIVFASLYCE